MPPSSSRARFSSRPRRGRGSSSRASASSSRASVFGPTPGHRAEPARGGGLAQLVGGADAERARDLDGALGARARGSGRGRPGRARARARARRARRSRRSRPARAGAPRCPGRCRGSSRTRPPGRARPPAPAAPRIVSAARRYARTVYGFASPAPAATRTRRGGRRSGRCPRMGSFQGVFDHVTIRASDRAASRALLHHRAGRARDRPDALGRPVRRVERLLAGGGTAWSPSPPAFTSASARPRPSAWTSSGRPASTPATRATASPARGRVRRRLLRRLPARPRRQQRRGGPLRGRAPRGVDHLWVRVADVERSARFYEAIAPFAGLREEEREGRAQFAGPGAGSFSVLWATT